MPAGIVRTGVILRALGGQMRTPKKFWPVRSRMFRFLVVVAGVFLLTAVLAPKANAQNVLVYFNFEHPNGAIPDFQSVTIGPPDNNPGGGLVLTTLELVPPLANVGNVDGTLLNRTPGDIDNADPGIGLGMRTTPVDNLGGLQFHMPTTLFSAMTLSFAIDTAGNGFDMVAFSYSTNGGVNFIPVGTSPIAAGGGFQLISFAVPVGAEGQPDVIFRLIFDGGTSQGQNLQTIIDNIRIDGIPEPATVAGGLLGVLGLGWQQRRRLIRSVRFRRT
jgi:hypothetical protein